ncbi:YfhO family protein, partial [Candidatus Saccharibacteria bacterium]|nr:YfhO family protein [Candidatus Saccharibacteria bacterium]
GVVGGVIVLQCIDNVMHIAMTEKYLDSRDAILATVEVEEGTEIGMYRTEVRDLWYNDAIMQQRYSLNGFSSTNSERWLSYLNLLGFTKNDRTKIQYNNGTTAGIEDLLAIKYVEGEENEDVWPMMTVVDARVREVKPTADEQKWVRPFEFYNRMFMAMADGGEVYRLRGTTEVIGENYCVKEGEKAGNRDIVKCDGMYSRIGQEAYVEDAGELARYKELVPGVELGRKGAELAGEVEVDSDGKMLMLSLPYSEGWTAEIDGTPVPAERVLGGLMGFAVPKGEHKVILKFTPPGLTAGILVTVESVLVLVIYGIMVKRSFYGESKRRKRFNSKKFSSTKA